MLKFYEEQKQPKGSYINKIYIVLKGSVIEILIFNSMNCIVKNQLNLTIYCIFIMPLFIEPIITVKSSGLNNSRLYQIELFNYPLFSQ